jgi:hypothetical protein
MFLRCQTPVRTYARHGDPPGEVCVPNMWSGRLRVCRQPGPPGTWANVHAPRGACSRSNHGDRPWGYCFAKPGFAFRGAAASEFYLALPGSEQAPCSHYGAPDGHAASSSSAGSGADHPASADVRPPACFARNTLRIACGHTRALRRRFRSRRSSACRTGRCAVSKTPRPNCSREMPRLLEANLPSVHGTFRVRLFSTLQGQGGFSRYRYSCF